MNQRKLFSLIPSGPVLLLRRIFYALFLYAVCAHADSSTNQVQDLADMPLESLDVDRAVAAWPDTEATHATITRLLGDGELADKASLEMSEKQIALPALRERLLRLREVWPELRGRLRVHLPPAAKLLARGGG